MNKVARDEVVPGEEAITAELRLDADVAGLLALAAVGGGGRQA